MAPGPEKRDIACQSLQNEIFRSIYVLKLKKKLRRDFCVIYVIDDVISTLSGLTLTLTSPLFLLCFFKFHQSFEHLVWENFPKKQFESDIWQPIFIQNHRCI